MRFDPKKEDERWQITPSARDGEEEIRTGCNIALDAATFSSSMRTLPLPRRVNGWVTERSIVHAWKACVPLYGTGGSNPPPSAPLAPSRARAQPKAGMITRVGVFGFVFGCLSPKEHPQTQRG